MGFFSSLSRAVVWFSLPYQMLCDTLLHSHCHIRCCVILFHTLTAISGVVWYSLAFSLPYQMLCDTLRVTFSLPYQVLCDTLSQSHCHIRCCVISYILTAISDVVWYSFTLSLPYQVLCDTLSHSHCHIRCCVILSESHSHCHIRCCVTLSHSLTAISGVVWSLTFSLPYQVLCDTLSHSHCHIRCCVILSHTLTLPSFVAIVSPWKWKEKMTERKGVSWWQKW